jgi:hypothetical protein
MSHEANGSSGNLNANFPLEHNPELTIGSIVRSRHNFRDLTAKVLRFEIIGDCSFAIVEISIQGSLTEYPYLIGNLEVVA